MADEVPDWINEAARKANAAAWETWTDEQRAAVHEAIEWRGKGVIVSAEAVARRLRSLGADGCNRDHVNGYCRKVLGRRSLAQE